MLELNTRDFGNEGMLQLFDAFKNQMQFVSDKYGIPISRTKLLELQQDTKKQLEYLDREIKKELNLPQEHVINYTGRLYNQNNIVMLWEKKYNVTRDYFLNEKSEIVNNEEIRLNFVEYLKSKNIKDTVLPLITQRNRYDNLDSACAKMLNRASIYMMDKELIEGDIFTIHPTKSMAKTFRLQDKDPNLAGMQAGMKECITAYGTMQVGNVDIKGQEIGCLVSKHMSNKELIKLIEHTGDPYNSFLMTIGIEPTPLLRQAIKVPVLGIMRGMSSYGAKDRINETISLKEHPEIIQAVDKLFMLIEGDPVYRETVIEFKNNQKRKPIKTTRGAFGTIQTITKPYGNLDNQIMNGVFQITGAELCAIGAVYFQNEASRRFGGYDKVRLISTIMDEYIILYEQEFEDGVLELLEEAATPIVDDWVRSRCEISHGKHYKAK